MKLDTANGYQCNEVNNEVHFIVGSRYWLLIIKLTMYIIQVRTYMCSAANGYEIILIFGIQLSYAGVFT